MTFSVAVGRCIVVGHDGKPEERAVEVGGVGLRRRIPFPPADARADAARVTLVYRRALARNVRGFFRLGRRRLANVTAGALVGNQVWEVRDMEDEPEYNVELWFEMGTHCDGRHYILGNPHTFPGRMMGWCPKKSGSFFFSLAEVGESSPLARIWMAGFLCGNEPPPPRGESGDIDFASNAYKRWQHSSLSFRATGDWPNAEKG